MWKNNFQDEDDDGQLKMVYLEKDQLKTQIENLLTAINKLPNFSLMRLEEMKKKITEEAKKRRENEETQYQTVRRDYEIPVIKEKTEFVTKERPTIVTKKRWLYTKREIHHEKYLEATKVLYTENERKTEEMKIDFPKRELAYYEEIVKREFMEKFKNDIV